MTTNPADTLTSITFPDLALANRALERMEQREAQNQQPIGLENQPALLNRVAEIERDYPEILPKLVVTLREYQEQLDSGKFMANAKTYADAQARLTFLLKGVAEEDGAFKPDTFARNWYSSSTKAFHDEHKASLFGLVARLDESICGRTRRGDTFFERTAEGNIAQTKQVANVVASAIEQRLQKLPQTE